MASDLQTRKIICTAYSWYGLTADLKEVNFHSKNVTPVKKGSVDLALYLLNGSEIKYSNKIEEIDRVADSLQLFSTGGSVTLQLSNVKQPRLSEFFKIYDTAYNRFTRYKVEIFNKGKLEFKGTVSIEDLELAFPPGKNDRKIIELTVYAWDAELKEYASNHEMPAFTEDEWSYTPRFPGIDVDRMSLTVLVNKLFDIPNHRIIFDSGITGDMNLNRWSIFRHPFLIPGYNIFNGYDLIKQNFNFSIWDFFKKLCNSMGWVPYLKYNAAINDIVLIVRNRVTHKSFYNELILDASKVLNYKIKFTQYGQWVETLKLPAAELRAGINILPTSEVNGARDLIYTNISTPSDNVLFYTNIYQSGSALIASWFTGYIHSKFMEIEGGKHKYNNYSAFYAPPFASFTKGERFEYKNDFLLEIDGGANAFQMKSKRGINMSNMTPSYFSDTQAVGSDDIVYCGNIGTAMIYDDGLGNLTQYFHYNTSVYDAYNYSKSAQLKANNRALLSGPDNLILEVTVYGEYKDTDYLTRFINNYRNAEPAFNFKYDFISSEVNATLKTTTFNLRKRND
jgi:hypothetical protein